MTLTVQHLDHIALTVQNIEASITWYCEVLGLEHRYRGLWNGVPAMLFAGETGLALFPVQQHPPAPAPDGRALTMTHFAFRVDYPRFLAFQRHLQAMDVPYEFQDHDIAHSIYFLDPDGHQVEITTYDIE